jgi:glycosyltransferase involved in cell wall biosynthesis
VLASRLRKRPYDIEEYGFALGMLPRLGRGSPDVVMLSDWEVGRALVHWRRVARRRYALLFSNGAPRKPPFAGFDLVQHVTPAGLQAALDAGEPEQRHVMVPYAIRVEPTLTPTTPEERHALRRSLRLPPEREIVISAAAIKRTHKRVDYIVEEVARLPPPRPFLLLLGSRDPETDFVLSAARSALGSDGYAARTVPREAMPDYYRAGDLLVLASLNEGFGLVLAEAMANGLPCVAHAHEVSRFVVGEHGLLGDLRKPAALAAMMRDALERRDGVDEARARHRFVFERFSWEVLRERYVEMVEAARRR